MARRESNTDVLIVGAGPVGLTAACELRRRGVDCRVVDRLPEPPHYAKAVGIQPRTVELWEAMGLERSALDAAIELRGMVMIVNGTETMRIELSLPDDVPYRFFALPRYETERLLAEHLAGLGGAPERGVELVSFEQDADGVTGTLQGPGGEETVRAQYLVGADGAHSIVRKTLGLSFGGGAFPDCGVATTHFSSSEESRPKSTASSPHRASVPADGSTPTPSCRVMRPGEIS